MLRRINDGLGNDLHRAICKTQLRTSYSYPKTSTFSGKFVERSCWSIWNLFTFNQISSIHDLLPEAKRWVKYPENLFEFFIYSVMTNSMIESRSFSFNWVKYLNRPLIRTIRFLCVPQLTVLYYFSIEVSPQ